MICEHVNGCFELEADRGIAKTTVRELSRYLHIFADYCQENQIIGEQLSSDFHHKLSTTAVYTHLSAKRIRELMKLHAYCKDPGPEDPALLSPQRGGVYLRLQME